MIKIKQTIKVYKKFKHHIKLHLENFLLKHHLKNVLCFTKLMVYIILYKVKLIKQN